MRMILGLILVSSQPPFSVGTGNLPETCGADSGRKGLLLSGYQKKRTARRRADVKGTKAHSDNSHLPTASVNWRLPKPECS